MMSDKRCLCGAPVGRMIYSSFDRFGEGVYVVGSVRNHICSRGGNCPEGGRFSAWPKVEGLALLVEELEERPLVFAYDYDGEEWVRISGDTGWGLEHFERACELSKGSLGRTVEEWTND